MGNLDYNFDKILNLFKIEGNFLTINPINAGHINDTFLIKTDVKNYILQKINHSIFKNIPELQNNILRVTEHIKQKLIQNNIEDINRKVLQLIAAKDENYFVKDKDGNYWRMLSFIEGSHSYDKLSSPELAFNAGLAFGEFDAMLFDLPGEPLFDTIKDFHNLQYRIDQLNDALIDNNVNRAGLVRDEIKAIAKRKNEMLLFYQNISNGSLPKRIIHCDTKINNVLFDEKYAILCVIDLYTVMSGTITSDFGDAIRSGTNTGAEDDMNLENVSMHIDLFEAYTKGFLKGTKSFLTPQEKDCLAYSAKMFAYMQAVRFITDYINGDIYYKIEYPEHNLQRTKAQLKLLYSMEEQYDDMRKIVDSCS